MSARLHSPRLGRPDPRWLVALLFFAAWGVLQSPGLLSGTIPWDERFSEYIPWRIEAARILLGGEFPHFTHRLFGGIPLFSQAYGGVLYPPNLLYLSLNPFVANWLAAFHTVLGGMGMLAYLRAWRVRWIPAMVGAAGFVALAFHAHHAAHVSMREAALVAPWVAWAARGVLRGRRPGTEIVLALVLFLQIAIGYWQVVLLTGLWVLAEVGAAYVISPRGYRAVAMLVLGAAFAAGLSMVQFLPALAHVEESPRASLTLERWQENSFPPDHVVLFANPRALGTINDGFATTGDGWEVVGMAMPTINLLALLGLVAALFGAVGRGRRRWMRWMAAAWLASILLALGSHFPANALLHETPPFSFFRVPSRWLLVQGALSCVLAAHGLQYLFSRSPARRPLMLVSALGGLLFLVSSLSRSAGAPLELGDVLARGGAQHYVPLVGIFLLVSVPRSARGVFLVLTLLMMMAENGDFVRSATPSYSDHAFVRGDAPRPVLDVLSGAEVQRVYTLYPQGPNLFDGLLLPHNTAVFRGIPALAGYSPLLSARLREFTGIDQRGLRPSDEDLLRNPALLRQLGVSHVLAYLDQVPADAASFWLDLDGTQYRVVESDDQAFVLEVLHAGRRFQPATTWIMTRTAEEDWQALHDPTIPVESLPVAIPGTEDIGRLSPRMRPGARIEVEPLDLRENRQRLWVRAEGDGVLLQRDVWWPGWRYRARGVEGGEGNVLRANAILRAVPLPEGEYELELFYRPPGFRRGLAISLLTLLVMIGWRVTPWCAGRSRWR